MWPANSSAMFVAVIALGTAVGSFLNVLVERTRQETSPWRGRSACLHCGRSLSWFELVPIVSWVALGGRCRTCRTRIALQYLTMEVLTAIGFVLVWLAFGVSWETVFGWGVVMAMIALAVYDAKWALLPDEWSFWLAGVGAAAALVAGRSVIDIFVGGIIGAGFFGAQWMASRGRWVGSGDIFLGLALGILLGWRMFGLALLLGYMSGAVIASIQILRKKLTLRQSMPFGPYLLGGGLVAWLYGSDIIDWYFNHAIFR